MSHDNRISAIGSRPVLTARGFGELPFDAVQIAERGIDVIQGDTIWQMDIGIQVRMISEARGERRRRAIESSHRR